MDISPKNEIHELAPALLRAAAAYAGPALQAYAREHPEDVPRMATWALTVRVADIGAAQPSVSLLAIDKDSEVILLGTTTLQRLAPSAVN